MRSSGTLQRQRYHLQRTRAKSCNCGSSFAQLSTSTSGSDGPSPRLIGRPRRWRAAAIDPREIGASHPSRSISAPYINAATVPGRVEEVSYIVTQHPLPSTVLHFWQMVLELQPTAIVMLNGHIHVDESQDGFALAPYWEPSAVVAPLELRVEEMREDAASECNVRMLMCQRTEAKRWRGPQIVVPWWRDQSEPPLEGFLQLDRLLDSFLTPGEVHSVLVHCAGGIGRAGVFIAADAGARAACQGKVDCSPDRLIGHLRRCRMNMVQTAEQYEFLHRALPVLTEQLRVTRPAHK